MLRLDYLVGAFGVTAAWDVVLRGFSERKLRLLGIEDWRWVRVLAPYFARHTVLAAALIAGLVGAIAYAVIASVAVPRHLYWPWVVLVSALLGAPMRWSGLFPHLKRYYYDRLGLAYSTATDALSGLVVGLTMVVLHRLGGALARSEGGGTRSLQEGEDGAVADE